uniref:Reverse transcriptase domain-containing protein n=1 Tax=Trichogramma kaykai TaxID=54128 RepID=A0ABD2WH38_9HYME
MRQLAEDGRKTHPEVAKALHHQLYVDDVFFGADSLEQALVRRDEIIDLLASAGMRLGKWTASNPKLIDGLVSTSEDVVPLNVDELVSTLGLKWLPGQDSFTFQFAARPTQVEITKRSILAEIARTFDPLGWLSPALVPAKVLLPGKRRLGGSGLCNFEAAMDGLYRCSARGFPHPNQEMVKHARRRGLALAWLCGRFQASLCCSDLRRLTWTRITFNRGQDEARPDKGPDGAQTGTVCRDVTGSTCKAFDKQVTISPQKSILLVGLESRIGLDSLSSIAMADVCRKQADCSTRGLTPLELAKFSLWWYGPSWLIEEETSWPRLTEPGEVTASTVAVESTA